MARVPLDIVVAGQALNSGGLTAFDTVSGVGLNTFGFLWPCDGVWQPSDSSITTTWVAASIPTTTVEVCVDDNGGLFA